MNISTSERRQIENEMIFRRSNEKVTDGLVMLDAMHIEDGNPEMIHDADLTLNFLCECSDENCKERIPMKLKTFQKIHEDRDCFVIKLGHQVDTIEDILTTGDAYSVVKKNHTIAEPGAVLNKTDINNV